MNTKVVENEIETSNNAKPVKIAVCVITCFRPDGLKRLLEGMAVQKFVKNTTPDMRLVIVDNDAKGSARTVCNEFANQHQDIELVYETRKAKRNSLCLATIL